jgi:hypothetical protein
MLRTGRVHSTYTGVVNLCRGIEIDLNIPLFQTSIHSTPPCDGCVLFCRLSLLDDKYKVIKSPIEHDADIRSFLGRWETGVHIAAIAGDGLPRLRVWTLSESSNHMEWMPKD